MSLLTIAITVGVLLAIVGGGIALKVWCEVQEAERVLLLARARASMQNRGAALAARRRQTTPTCIADENIPRGSLVVIDADNRARLWRAEGDSRG